MDFMRIRTQIRLCLQIMENCTTQEGADVPSRTPPNLHPFHPPALMHYLHDEIHQQSHDRWKQIGQISAHVGGDIVYMCAK